MIPSTTTSPSGRPTRTTVVLLLLSALTWGVVPTPVSADANETPGAPRAARAITAGGFHTCALLDDGVVRCWGSGANGRLGIGSTTSIGNAPGEMGSNLSPVDLGTGRTATAISAGGGHTCALLDNATVKCWGRGANGQLGTGLRADVGGQSGEMGDNLPPIPLGTSRTATAITAGDDHTCALLDNSTVKCWGNGAHGRLGQGGLHRIGDEPGDMGDNLPTVDLGTSRTATAITAGDDHTCALLDNSTVKCWGDGNDGQLGTGDIEHLGDEPGEMGDNLPTVDLGTSRTATAITAGDDHTCALLDNSTVKCWGDGFAGRLGLGSTDDIGDGPGEMGDNLPTVDLGTGRTATAITAGTDHTCALLDNGTVKCWGDGDKGALGTGDIEDLGDQPGETGDNLPTVDLGTGRTATAITAGDGHTCALLDNARLKCWGYGFAGRLGLGNTDDIGDGPGEMGDALPFVDLPGPLAASRVNVTLSTPLTEVVAGATVRYTVRITNTGHQTLRGVVLSAPGMACGPTATTLTVGATRTIACTVPTTAADVPVLRRTVSVSTTNSVLDAPVNAQSTTVSTRVAQRRSRPDAQVRVGTKPYVGNDRYNTNAKKQSVTARATADPARYTVRVQNDGNATDAIIVRGTKGNARFAVTYLRNGKPITKKVTAGAYRITGLAPRAALGITVVVTPRATATAGDRIAVSVRATSVTSPTKVDVVRMVTVRR